MQLSARTSFELCKVGLWKPAVTYYFALVRHIIPSWSLLAISQRKFLSVVHEPLSKISILGQRGFPEVTVQPTGVDDEKLRLLSKRRTF